MYWKKGNSNHDMIERFFVKELNELSSGTINLFYCSALNKMVHVHFESLAALGDQPERRQINYLSNGNALYSARYGYACNINELKHVLSVCNKCALNIKAMNNHTPIVCNRCLNWVIMINNELSEIHPSKDYLVEKLHENGKNSNKGIKLGIVTSSRG